MSRRPGLGAARGHSALGGPEVAGDGVDNGCDTLSGCDDPDLADQGPTRPVRVRWWERERGLSEIEDLDGWGSLGIALQGGGIGQARRRNREPSPSTASGR